MKILTAEDVITLHQRSVENVGQHRTRLDDLSRYLAPQLLGHQSAYGEGQQLDDFVFDTTGIRSASKLARFMFSNIMQGKWLNLKTNDDDLNDDDTVAEWLEHATSRVIEAFAESNYRSEGSELMLALVVLGTASMDWRERDDPTIPDEDFKGLTTRANHLGNLTFLENSNFEVDLTFMEVEWTARQAAQAFGLSALPGLIQEAYEADSLEKFSFIHCIYPRYDSYDDYPKGKKALPADKKPIASVHVCKKTADIVKTSGYDKPARTVTRWQRAPAWNDGYGYGCGDEVIASVKSRNYARKLEFSKHEMDIEPPMKTRQNNVLGQLKIRRRGLTLCKDPNALQELFPQRDMSWVLISDERLEAEITQGFLLDEIIFPDAEATEMTAYEFSRRIKLMQQQFGPVLQRLITEHYDPGVERVFTMMYDKGAIDPAPSAIANARLDVEYTGPLMMAMRAEGLEALIQWGAMVLNFSEKVPNVIDVPDWDELCRSAGRDMGISEKLINDVKKIAKTRKIRAAQEAEMAEAEQQEKRAGVVRNLADAQRSVSG